MSKESIEWLNANVLMGFVDDREKWASNMYAGITGDQARPWFAGDNYSNGYTGPVPIEAVETLFGWEALEGPLFSYVPCDMDKADFMTDDGQPMRKVVDDTRKSILHPRTGKFLNVTAQSYGVHQYSEWLVKNVGTILDDDLAIDSAGLLMEGGVAWVSVSLPETIETNVGFAIRPRLLAFTSHNSKYMTTYKRSLEAPVCDNSLDIETRRDGNQAMKWKQKHTARSGLKIADAREALGILYQQADDMVAFVHELAKWEVTNQQFAALMNQLHPVPEVQMEEGKVKNQRAINTVVQRRTDITNLYLRDDRAAPWKDTALGVLQAHNTYDQQEKRVQGRRFEQKMRHTLKDDVAKFDAIVLNSLAELSGREAVAA